jgi:hypothetical protein
MFLDAAAVTTWPPCQLNARLRSGCVTTACRVANERCNHRCLAGEFCCRLLRRVGRGRRVCRRRLRPGARCGCRSRCCRRFSSSSHVNRRARRCPPWTSRPGCAPLSRPATSSCARFASMHNHSPNQLNLTTVSCVCFCSSSLSSSPSPSSSLSSSPPPPPQPNFMRQFDIESSEYALLSKMVNTPCTLLLLLLLPPPPPPLMTFTSQWRQFCAAVV